MSVQVWRHLPVEKQVIEFTGDNSAEIRIWANGRAYLDDLNNLAIRTPQGDMTPAVGDYIVCGVEAEFYPVPRSIFLASYEPVGERA